jgi:hypothetical protein
MDVPFNKFLKYLFYSFVIVVFTFPFVDTVADKGLDMSYMWAFNYFFANGIQAGKDFVFTYGPLGFIKLPMAIGNNLVIGLALIFLIRLCFIYCIFLFCRICAHKNEIISFIVTFGLSVYFSSVDYAIICAVVCAVFLHYENKNTVFLLTAALLTVLGLLIKINIGITCTLISGSYLIYDFITAKSFKTILQFMLFYIIIICGIWMVVYYTLSGMLLFFRNIYLISTGNLGATSLNTPNNWWLLGVGFFLFFLFPIVNKNQKINMLFYTTALAFYMIFKYSFAREENNHMLHLFNFIVLISCFYLLLIPVIKILHAIWLLVAIACYNLNMHESGRYQMNDEVQFTGINNFREYFLNFDALLKKSKQKSKENFNSAQLPASFLNKIKNETIDSYPWELSYIAANSLNYHPRPLFQLGCASSIKLDAENAAFVQSKRAAKFILWHKGWCNDRMCSIDERYLLNDDFRTLYQLLNHYKIVDSSESVLLLERTQKELLDKPVFSGSATGKWNEWIVLPQIDSTAIIIAKIKIANNFLGTLKSAFYKENEYYMEYALSDGRIVRHRFIATSAESGVWITPYLFNLSNNLSGFRVNKIKFITTDDPNLMQNNIAIEWEIIHKKAN